MKKWVYKIPKGEYLFICLILLLAFISFWFVFPIYTFDSRWYIGYLDYFRGAKPLNEWNTVRGFTFPTILWIAYLLHPDSLGVEIILCLFYIIWTIYIYKLFILIKKECYQKKLNYGEILIIGVFLVFNPIIWGYAHVVLTETISLFFLTIYIFYALKFFFKRRSECAKRSDYILFLVFSCILTSILWFLKQSFFANTIFVATILEFELIIYKKNIKRVFYAVLVLVAMVLSIKISTLLWNNIVGITHNSFSEGLPNKICCLRYFYPDDENIDNGHTGVVSVMDDDYKVIDTFEYTFEEGILSRLGYVWKCFINYPERVMMGYVDNYMIMADIFQNPVKDDIRGKYTFGKVIRNQPIQTVKGAYHLSAEHRNIVKYNMSKEYDSRVETESAKDLLESINSFSDITRQYITINSPNTVSKIMSSDFIWNITMLGYAILLLGAPCIMVYSFFSYLCDKNKTIRAVYFMLSGYAFGFLVLHVVTGQAIDRYAFTVYAVMLIILISDMINIYGWLRRRLIRSFAVHSSEECSGIDQRKDDVSI